MIDRIKSNAAWVVQNYGPQSGLAEFGYDAPSVEYVEGFIERQISTITESEESIQKFVSFIGSFLGECIVATYGGEWSAGREGPGITIKHGEHVHFLKPFEKVHKRIVNGPEDNIYVYFADFIPHVLQNAGRVAPPARRGPWWKFWRRG